MSLREYKPRLSVEISETTDDALRRLIPHNMKSPVVRAMLEMLIHLIEEKPNARINILNLIVLKEFDVARATYRRAIGKEQENE